MRFFLIFSLVVSASAWGHGDHSSKESLELAEHVLEAAFVEVSGDLPETAEVRPFEIIDEDGNTYYLKRSELTRALVAAFRVWREDFQHLNHRHPSDPRNWLIKWAHGWMKRLNPMNWKPGEWPLKIQTFVHGLPNWAVRVHGKTSILAKEIGLLPTFAVLFVGFPPYFFVTEGIEMLFLGPFHAFCHFFLVIYFYKLIPFLGSKIAQLRHYWNSRHFRHDENPSLWRKIGRIFKSRKAASSFRSLFQGVKTGDQVLSHGDFEKKHGSENVFFSLLSRSHLWTDLYVEAFSEKKPSATPVSDEPRKARNVPVEAVEEVLNLELVAQLLEVYQTQRFKSQLEPLKEKLANGSELPPTVKGALKFVRAQRFLGQTARLIEDFKARVFYAYQSESMTDPEFALWRNAVSSEIQKTLSMIFHFTRDSVSESEERIEERLDHIRESLRDFSDADFACETAVAA